MKKREPIHIQMEILASLFASPKVVTRLAQSCNVIKSRMSVLLGPLLARGLVTSQAVEGQEVLSITDAGYRLYSDWLEIWKRLAIVT